MEQVDYNKTEKREKNTAHDEYVTYGGNNIRN